MKKILFLFLIVVISQAGGWTSVYADTLDTMTVSGNLNPIWLGSEWGTKVYHLGYQYRPGAGYNICSITLPLYKGASGPADYVFVKIYKHGTTIATSSTDNINGGTLVASADSGQYVSNTVSANYEFTFTPCYFIQGGYWHTVDVTRSTPTATSSIYIRGNSSNQASTVLVTGTGQFVFGYQTDTNVNNYASAINSCEYGVNYMCSDFNVSGTENFSNFTASSTTGYSSTSCTPPNSILDVGGGVSYAFCFMFVPAQSVIDQYTNIYDLLSTKFPFAYLTSINTAIGSSTADTGALPTLTFSVPIGNATSTYGILSTSTVGAYISPTNLALFRTLMEISLWIGFAYMIFFSVKNLVRS